MKNGNETSCGLLGDEKERQMVANIVCPNCSFSKKMPMNALPPEGTRATCPKCSKKFIPSQQILLRQRETIQQVVHSGSEKLSNTCFESQSEKINRVCQEDKSFLLEQKMIVEKNTLKPEDSPSVSALKRKSDIYLLAYLGGLLSLSFVQINSDNPVMYFVNVISALVPSITDTASISPNPNCAKLILSLCWVVVIPLYIFSMKKLMANMTQQGWYLISARICKYVGTKNIVFTYIFVLMFTFTLLYGLYFYNPIGGHSWRRASLYKLISSSNIYMPIWGVCITCGVWAILYFISMMSYGIFTKGLNKFNDKIN